MSISSSKLQIDCNQISSTKMLYHSAKYVTCDVYGVLIGSQQNNSMTICDAFPLFHSRIMGPTLEVAFNLIENKLKKGQQILGIYQGLVNDQSNQQDQVSEQSLKLCQQISNNIQKDSIIIKMSNDEQTIKLQAYQYSKNYENAKSIQNLKFDQDKIIQGIKNGDHRFIIDFDNHFENSKQDFCNIQVQ